MLEYLPEDIRRGLEAARARAGRQRARLCVHVGDAVFPVRRMWEGGFAVDAVRTPLLRGLVDIYDGPRHLSHCLIVASDTDGGDRIYEFKRVTPAGEGPMRDFADDQPPPIYLPGPR